MNAPALTDRDLQLLLLDLLGRRYRTAPDEPLPDAALALSEAGWQRLVDLAHHHALAPLLYDALQRAPESARLPNEAMQALRRLYRDNALRNMSLYRELHRVLAALQAAGIPVIVLKGAYLAQAVYGNVALRPMVDLDLLVEWANVERAEIILQELGYETIVTGEPPREIHYHIRLLLSEDEIFIELHWQMQRPTFTQWINIDELWDRAQRVTIAGIEGLALSNADLLLTVCLHTAYKHTFSFLALRSLCDVSWIIDKCYVDWGLFLRIVRRSKCEHAIYLTLLLACKLFGALIPDSFLKALEVDNFDKSLFYWTMDYIFSVNYIVESGNPERADSTSNSLLNFYGLICRFADFYRLCFPPLHVVARVHLLSPNAPRSILFLTYLRRIVYNAANIRIVISLLRNKTDPYSLVEQKAKRYAVLSWILPK